MSTGDIDEIAGPQVEVGQVRRHLAATQPWVMHQPNQGPVAFSPEHTRAFPGCGCTAPSDNGDYVSIG